jgi:putative phosphoribosyl transferase
MRLFANRREAARELAADLQFTRGENPIVLALPNGGVPIAEIIARELAAPLDLLLIEKLRAPKNPEHIVGAVDEHGKISMIQATARWHHLTSQQMVGPARMAFAELQSRRAKFRAIIPELDVRGRTVIVVDEGVATGAKMLAAVASLRDRGARKVIVTAPAGTEKAIWQLHESANVVVIPHRPSTFHGIEKFYQTYAPVTDGEVIGLLREWAASRASELAEIKTLVLRLVNDQQRVIHCEIDLPPTATRGSGPYPAVIFAHGFDSDARSPRSVPISQRLAQRGIIGVRLDFTGHGRSEGRPEDATPLRMHNDLRTVIENVCRMNEVDPNRVGLNGSGTGGMIALHFAAHEPTLGALVIRGPVTGGEFEAARRVTAPTLLIHCAQDTALLESVQAIDRTLAATHQLLEIRDCSRMFNDPVSLELMVSATVDWFGDNLQTAPRRQQQPSRPVSQPANAVPQ